MGEPARDITDELRDLDQQRNSGSITEDEFQERKLHLVQQMTGPSEPQTSSAAPAASPPSAESASPPAAQKSKPNTTVIVLLAVFFLPALPFYLASKGVFAWKWVWIVVGAFFAIGIFANGMSSIDSSSTSTPTPAVEEPDKPDMRISKDDLEESIRDDFALQATGQQVNVEEAECTALDEIGSQWSCMIRPLGSPDAAEYTIEVNEDGEWAGQPVVPEL